MSHTQLNVKKYTPQREREQQTVWARQVGGQGDSARSIQQYIVMPVPKVADARGDPDRWTRPTPERLLRLAKVRMLGVASGASGASAWSP